MAEVKDKERAIIELTCVPEVSIEKAQKLYEIGFKHLKELLEFSLDEKAKEKGLVDILNYRILSQFITVDEEDIPMRQYKCPYCMSEVYADEEDCSGCGALFLEEILEIEKEEVYKGLQEIIDTILENPELSKSHLESLKKNEIDTVVEEREIAFGGIDETPVTERGFVASSVIPGEEGKNYLVVLSPLAEHETERKKVFEDLKELGTVETLSFSIEGGNIANKQEKAVGGAVSRLLKEPDLKALGLDSLCILNLKIARFRESDTMMIIEDNRHFLSSMDGISAEGPNVEALKNMLHDADLIHEARKTSSEFELDEITFNNDPISFLLARACIPIIRERQDLNIRLLDVVVNTNYVEHGNHNELIKLLQKW